MGVQFQGSGWMMTRVSHICGRRVKSRDRLQCRRGMFSKVTSDDTETLINVVTKSDFNFILLRFQK